MRHGADDKTLKSVTEETHAVGGEGRRAERDRIGEGRGGEERRGDCHLSRECASVLQRGAKLSPESHDAAKQPTTSSLMEAKMRAAVFLALVLYLCLISMTAAASDQNSRPCLLSNRTTAYKTFLQRHILEGAPSTEDQNAWEALLRSKKFCFRPTQSFLPESERQRVEAVCSPSGGKTFEGNMCISKQPFSFITVRVEHGTCGIKRIERQTRHLILACEKLRNVCQPVHFEGNPMNLSPDKNMPDCGLGRASAGVRTTAGLLSALSLLLVALEVAL
ncbi:hypothetical protein ACEWY4_020228 [Coilia grayii]|uniref:Ribonuclease A-domain domain-containing protein n=1 Tax=Coilia grayii TaxID=363190 RepID=A0ABD1JC05_9TELE